MNSRNPIKHSLRGSLIIVRGGFLCTVIQLIFLSFRVEPEFQGTYHVLYTLSLSL